MTLQPLDLVCSSCGFRCCPKGEQLCDSAIEQTASFCTLEKYEARHAPLGINLAEGVVLAPAGDAPTQPAVREAP